MPAHGLCPRRRRPDRGAPARVLLPPLHGKEQECLRLLELPGSCPQSGPAALCCTTGGEDSLLRQQLLPLPPASSAGSESTPPGAFAHSALLAEHAQGTAVKALALLRLPGQGSGAASDAAAAEWLLLSAGARQVLMAHRLRQAPASAWEGAGVDGSQWRPPPLLPLLCDELAVKEPPVQPRRPKPGVRLGSERMQPQLPCVLSHHRAMCSPGAWHARRGSACGTLGKGLHLPTRAAPGCGGPISHSPGSHAPSPPNTHNHLLASPHCLPPAQDKLESDQRYLSISAFLMEQHHGLQPQRQQQQFCEQLPAGSPAQPTAPLGSVAQAAPGVPPLPVFVAAAASDASLELLCADLGGPRGELGTGRRAQLWRVAAALRHHACPVLCTAHCSLAVGPSTAPEPGPAGGGAGSGSGSARPTRHIVLSGGTDGSVAVWDVTAAAAAAASACAASACAASAAEAGCEEQPRVELAPVLVLTCLHQSGVNAMAAAPAGGPHFSRLGSLPGLPHRGMVGLWIGAGGKPSRA